MIIQYIIIMLKFDTFINERYREIKKDKSNYFTKVVKISKIELEEICEKMNLDYSSIKFLSSGRYGNAYKLNENYVLKITTDKNEAKSVYNLIKDKPLKSVVRYYDVAMYKLKNNSESGSSKYVYAILMDYVVPLSVYIKKIKNMDYEEYINSITDILWKHWGKIEDISKFEELIEENFEISSTGFGRLIVDQFWNLYNNLKSKKRLDIHIFNLGFRKKDLVLFDYSDVGTKSFVRKFDNPRILN